MTEDIDTMQAAGHVEIRGQEWSAKTDEPDRKDRKRYDCCSEWYPRCEAYCQREKKSRSKNMLNTIFLAILILIVVMLIISCVKIVRQAQAL